MSVYLLPQPKELRVIADGLACPVRGLRAELLCPEADERLKDHAEEIFASAVMLPAESSLYVLHAGEAPDAPIPPEDEEGYALATSEKGVTIVSVSARGLFYGMQTLAQLCEAESFAAVRIVDWPDLPFRSEYFDLRTLYPTFDRLLRSVRELASYKFNAVLVEFENKIPFRTMEKLRSPEAFTDEQLA